MGYNGLGLQRWIYTMKPRKFLGKRSKPDGGGGDPPFSVDINDYYHLEKNDLENLNKKKYPPAYKQLLNKNLKSETQKQNVQLLVSLIIAVIVLILIFAYLNSKLELF